MTIGALLGGFAQEKQRQHDNEYAQEMQERQLRLGLLIKAADSPDLTLEEKRHILNEAGTMMGTPAVKGLFGRTKRKASAPIALGDLLISDDALKATNIVPEGTRGAQRVDTPSSESSIFTPPQSTQQGARPREVGIGSNVSMGVLSEPQTITLEPPPGMYAIRAGDRRVGDIQDEREINKYRQQYEIKERQDAASDSRRAAQAIKVAEINAAARTQAVKLRTDAAENKDRNKLMRTFLNEVNGGDENDPVAVAEAYRRADDYQAQYNRLRLGKTQSEIELNQSRSSLNKEIAKSIPQRLEIMRENTRIGWTRVRLMDQANQIKLIELRTPDFKRAEAIAIRDTNATWTPTWTETKTNEYVEDELQEMRDAGTLTPELEQRAKSGDTAAISRLAQLQREARNRAEQRVKIVRQRYEDDRRADEILKMDAAKRGGARPQTDTGGSSTTTQGKRGKLGWRNRTSSTTSTPSTPAPKTEQQLRTILMSQRYPPEQIETLIRKAKQRRQLVDSQGKIVEFGPGEAGN